MSRTRQPRIPTPRKTVFDLTFRQAILRGMRRNRTAIGHDELPGIEIYIDRIKKSLRYEIKTQMTEISIPMALFLDNGWWLR